MCDLIEASDDGNCYMQQEAFCWLHERENGDRNIQTCSDDTKNPMQSRDCSVEQFYVQ